MEIDIDYDVKENLLFLSKEQNENLKSSGTINHKYLWWNVYLVKIDMKTSLEKLLDNFIIVDNLDAYGKWFIIKDINIKKCMVINEISGSSDLHIDQYSEQLLVLLNLTVLSNICEKVFPCMSIYPKISVCNFTLDELQPIKEI